MVTQDTILEVLHAGPALANSYWPVRLPHLAHPGQVSLPQPPLPLVAAGKPRYSRYWGQVTDRGKPYPHVENQFRESICSCTGTLPYHGVKSWQRASNCGSISSSTIRTPWLLPVAQELAVTNRCKSICSNGTDTRNYRAGRFLRNRNQIELKLRDYRGSNQSVLLAWLKPDPARAFVVLANLSFTTRIRAKARAGEVAAITIREILLRRLKGFRTKKFT